MPVLFLDCVPCDQIMIIISIQQPIGLIKEHLRS